MMLKYYYLIENKYDPGRYIGKVWAEPECGEDFCDSCGDCLHCYSGDPCYGNDRGEHFWVEYVDKSEQ